MEFTFGLTQGSKGDYNVVLYFGKPHTESGVAAAYLHHGKNVNLGSYSYNKPHKESLTTTCLSTGTGTLRTLLALSFLSSSTGEVELTDESGVGDCDTRLAIIRFVTLGFAFQQPQPRPLFPQDGRWETNLV